MFYGPYGQYSSEYERQQLNILRAARGIRPPIPPPRRYVDFVESMFVWTWHFFITTVVFVGLVLWFHPADTPTDSTPSMTWWQTILVLSSPLFTLGTLRARRTERLEREYQALLRRWEDAGCP